MILARILSLFWALVALAFVGLTVVGTVLGQPAALVMLLPALVCDAVSSQIAEDIEAYKSTRKYGSLR